MRAYFRATLLVITVAAITLPTVAHGAAAISTGCLPTQLPAVPTAPVFSEDVHFFSDQLHFDFWRQPCADGTGSGFLLRATPTSSGPFLCSGQFQIIQNGIQFTNVKLLPTPTSTSNDSFCTNLVIAQTFIFTSPSLDDKQAFGLIYDTGNGTPRFVQLDLPAASGSGLPVSLAAAAVLPTSRSVQIGAAATAFATVIATGPGTGIGCTISPITGVPGAFSYQTTDPSTNALTGNPNTPAIIPGGGSQTFVIALTPNSSFPPIDVQLAFDCSNTLAVGVISGVNTLLLSASASPVPDVVALAATLNNDGIVNIPGPTGTGVFAVATVNVGVGGALTASADTGNASLGITLSLCPTNPTTGACLAPPSASVTAPINAGETPTFGVFVKGNGTVAFNSATNRVFVRFKDAVGVTRGATSVAARTQ